MILQPQLTVNYHIRTEMEFLILLQNILFLLNTQYPIYFCPGVSWNIHSFFYYYKKHKMELLILLLIFYLFA